MSTYQMSKLSEVVTIISGKNQKAVQTDSGQYPIYGSGGMMGRASDYLCEAGTTIVGRKGTINKPIYVSERFWNVDTAFGITPNEKLLSKYLYFFCLSFNFKKLDKSTTIPSLAKRDLLDIDIPVPSLAEQQRIVAKIEELFSELDNSVAALKQTKAQLSVYRQAVLKDAFKDFKNWPAHTLGSLMEEVRNGYGLKPTGTGQHKILTIGSVREGKLNLEEHRLNDSSFEKKDTIDTNDLLFTRYNGNRNYVGICAIVPELNETFAYPDKLIKFVPRIKSVNHSKFLQYYVHQGEARKYIRSTIKTTSGQNGISGSDLKKTIIHLPSESVQVQIVEYIEAKLTLCDDIEKQIDKTLQQAESLRQSILKQAFEGKLV